MIGGGGTFLRGGANFRSLDEEAVSPCFSGDISDWFWFCTGAFLDGEDVEVSVSLDKLALFFPMIFFQVFSRGFGFGNSGASSSPPPGPTGAGLTGDGFSSSSDGDKSGMSISQ